MLPFFFFLFSFFCLVQSVLLIWVHFHHGARDTIFVIVIYYTGLFHSVIHLVKLYFKCVVDLTLYNKEGAYFLAITRPEKKTQARHGIIKKLTYLLSFYTTRHIR